MDTVEKEILCEYHYDPLDRVTAVSEPRLVPRQRFYLQKRLVTQIQGAHSLSLLQAPNALLAQLEQLEGQQASTLLAPDVQQSVLYARTGSQRHAIGYTAYGFHPLQPGLSGFPAFNGELPDPVTDHYLLGSGVRAFNPVLMRFNSPDSLSPFGKGGLNSYSYCAGDPVNNSDPSGHFLSRLIDLSWKVSYMVKTSAPISKAVDVVKTTAKITSMALNRAPLPHPPLSASRQALNDALTPLRNKAQYVKVLKAVNLNLGSYGDNTLPASQSAKYAGLAKAVDSGAISNTTGHIDSAASWTSVFIKEGDLNGVVGAVFNVAGAMMSGNYDHGLIKTGKGLIRGG